LLFGLPSFLVSCLLIFVVIFGFIISINSDKTPKLDYSYQSGNSSETKPKILVYELKGQIETGNNSSKRESGIYTEIIKKDFELIKKDKTISAVLFKLDTPGGSVFASEVLGDLQTELLRAKNQEIGVYYFDGLVASGGLFSSYKNPNYIVGSKYGYTGSIGVIAQLSNFKKLAENVGFAQTTIKAGIKKDYGNPLKEISKEEINYFQAQIDKVYDRFKTVIETGRKLDASKVSELATGEVWDNQQALKLGLLDEIGSEDLALKKLATLQKLGDYNVVTIESKPNFVDSITSQYFPILSQVNANILESNKMYMIKE
jgi:protease-4